MTRVARPKLDAICAFVIFVAVAGSPVSYVTEMGSIVTEPPDGLGHERHAPLALDPFPGDADAHARATLSNRPESGAVLAECGRSTPRR